MKSMKLLTVLLLASSLTPAGCDWFEAQVSANVPPATEIMDCPGSEVDEGQSIVFRWTGSDIDGDVVGYEWTLDGDSWFYTEDDSAFIEKIGAGRHSFSVRSVDDRGDVDPAPPVCEFAALAVGERLDRVVLIELFTTRTCANCANAEAALNELLDVMGRDSLCVVAYHDRSPGAPGADPLATDETVARIDWYTDDPSFPGRANWWPTATFDGIYVAEGAQFVDQTREEYDLLIGLRERSPSPLELALSGEFSAGAGHIEVVVKARGRLPEGALVLRAVVVEDHVFQPPSLVDFVARRIRDDEILGIAEIGDSSYVGWDFEIDEDWNLSNLDVIVIVQNDSNREVLQSRRLVAE